MATARRGVVFSLLAFAVLAGPAAAVPPITTVAGGGSATPSTGAAGTAIDIGQPAGVAVVNLENPPLFAPPPNGSFVFARWTDCAIDAIKNTSYDGLGTWAPLAGNGNCTSGNYDSTTGATAGPLGNADGISGTSAGELYIADRAAERVHYVASGQIRTIAGINSLGCTATAPSSGDPINANFCTVTDVAAHPTAAGTYLIAEQAPTAGPFSRSSGGRIYLVTGATDPINGTRGTLSIVAGGGCPTPAASPAAQVCFNGTGSLSVDWTAGGTGFVVAEVQPPQRVLRFSSTTFASSTVVETPMNEVMSDITSLPDATYLVTEGNKCRVRRVRVVSGEFTAEPFAGTNCGAPLGDGLPADQAGLGNVGGIADSDTGVFIADNTNRRIRFVERTVVTAGPPAFTKDTGATFTFDSTDRTPSYECSFNLNWDASAVVKWNSCTNPVSFTPPTVKEGLNRMWVRTAYQTNPPHADDTPKLYEWTVDTIPPAAFEPVEPADGATGLPPSPTFTWSASSDANLDHYELWIDDTKDGNVQCCEATAAAPLSEATHKWQVKALDKAGNLRASTSRTFSAGAPPVASFVAAPNPVLVGRPVAFDASASNDFSGIARHEWDLDGDGTFETDTGADARAARIYSTPGEVQVALRVTDGVGLTASATAPLRVNAAPASGTQVGVSINHGALYANKPDVTLNLNPPTGTTSLLVANDGGFLEAVTFAPKREIEWKLDSSGPERLPKTVYVRFLAGPFASPNYTDDIILDERSPTVQQASVTPAPAAATAAQAAALRKWKVKVRATDSNSGVGHVQVTMSKRKPGKLIKYKRTLTVKSAKRPMFLRARDRAGNYSRWKKLR